MVAFDTKDKEMAVNEKGNNRMQKDSVINRISLNVVTDVQDTDSFWLFTL